MYLEGPSYLAGTVFDHNDGTYEVLFLIKEPGVYKINMILDYTLCDGLIDPPIDWFQNGRLGSLCLIRKDTESLCHIDWKTLNKNDLDQVADQRFSLKQWFAAGAHSCRLRKTGSAHCYSTIFFENMINVSSNVERG